MLKKLGPYARPYSKWIAVGVLCSAAEAIFELLIPLVMADIVNIGIETANQNYILQKGLLMMGMAVISLCFGLGAAASSSVAGQGFGAELRRAEYEHIQDFAFSNIEKFSTASLVTRLTNDVNNIQMTLMMGMRLLVRAPVMLVAALVLRSTVWKDNVVAGAWMMVLVGAVCGLMYYVRKRYPGKRKVGGTMDTVISALLILFCVVYVGMGAMALVAMNK